MFDTLAISQSEDQLTDSPTEVRERCYECFRPRSLCFCEAIPQIDNRTDVLILQHVGERFHPFNTARIVRKALQRCELFVDHNQLLGNHPLPIQPSAGLLYPAADAISLSDLCAADRPDQLIMIDGTWDQAKTIVRDVPQLHGLPCYRLTPSTPGQNRIRREPNAHSLSTLEATVEALRALEPETVGLDQLLAAFHKMVEDQLEHSAGHKAWRHKRSKQIRPRYIPPTLLQDAQRLVVAYGEATPGQKGRRRGAPLPVNWVAQRLGTTQRFSCRLQQREPLSETALKHMRLSAADADAAVSEEEFRHRWNQFLRRDDLLVVYHQRTCELLRRVRAVQPRWLVLKSIFGKWRDGFRCLEDLLEVEGLAIPASDGKSRADDRLDMAVRLVEHLREEYGGVDGRDSMPSGRPEG